MKTPLLISLLALSLLGNAWLFVRNAPRSAQPATNPLTEADLGPALRPYASLGSYLAGNNRIPELAWTSEQFAAFELGVRAAYQGKPFPLDKEATALRDAITARFQTSEASAPQNGIESYFAELREKEKVLKTASNLHYRITQQGFGKTPKPGAVIVASYSARLPNGDPIKSLTSARTRSALSDLLPGLAEGMQLLKSGGKALFYLPPELSFGQGSWPQDVPKGAPVILFVELHEVINPEASK